jgi:hypothetical protein
MCPSRCSQPPRPCTHTPTHPLLGSSHSRRAQRCCAGRLRRKRHVPVAECQPQPRATASRVGAERKRAGNIKPVLSRTHPTTNTRKCTTRSSAHAHARTQVHAHKRARSKPDDLHIYMHANANAPPHFPLGSQKLACTRTSEFQTCRRRESWQSRASAMTCASSTTAERPRPPPQSRLLPPEGPSGRSPAPCSKNF